MLRPSGQPTASWGLYSPAPAADSAAYDINDLGQAVGDKQPRMECAPPSGLPPPPGSTSARSAATVVGSFGINNLGEVVGESATATGEMHAFLWTAADGMVDLGTLGGTFSTASGINNARPDCRNKHHRRRREASRHLATPDGLERGKAISHRLRRALRHLAPCGQHVEPCARPEPRLHGQR